MDKLQIKNYQLCNFKSFVGPITFPIRPITILFGPNSSGKSAILQSLLMLKQTLLEAPNDKIALLPKGNLVDLGSFREFVYTHNTTKSFSFKISMRMPKLAEIVASISMEENWIYQNIQGKVYQLEKSINFDIFGLEITFSLNRKESNIFVDKINLFLGEDSEPIITYNFRERKDNDVNTSHQYWNSYWETIVKEEIIKERPLI